MSGHSYDSPGNLTLTRREQLIMKLLLASSEMLDRVEAVLDKRQMEAALSDRRLLTLAAAAGMLGVSRMTIYRMTRDGRLPVVETRAGRYRVPSNALTALLMGAGEGNA